MKPIDDLPSDAGQRRTCRSLLLRTLLVCAAVLVVAGSIAAREDERFAAHHHHNATIMWINHLDFLPGDGTVGVASFPGPTAVIHGLSGLVIRSAFLGDVGEGGVNKEVLKGLEVPPGFAITGVRLCYELSNPRTFITQVRLAQVQDPPATALVLLDDATDLTNPGPVCVDSASTFVDPAAGAVRLSLRINTGDTTDEIVLRAVGLHLQHKS